MDARRSRNFVQLTLSLLVVGSFIFGAALPTQIARAGGGGFVLYAKPGGVHSGICATWGTACQLTYALHVVAAPGDQIWAAKGTYRPTTGTARNSVFSLKNGVAVYGGFTGTETLLSQRNWKTNVTVLSGDIGTVGVASDNSYNVVFGSGVDATAILDGFTITGGNANGASYPYNEGGGIFNNAASPILRNLIFSGNAAVMGGGMFNNNNSKPTVTNVTFSGNSVSNDGGGMFNNYSSPPLTNVTFYNNKAGNDGGGMYDKNSNPTLTKVTFNSNSASYGGGMANENSSPHLTNVVFNGNSAPSGSGWGGGMYNYGGSLTLTNVTFSGNSAKWCGGGMYNGSSSLTLTNVTFSGNSAFEGGGVYNHISSPMLKNVTFGGNTASLGSNGGGGMYNHYNSGPHVYNSMFWGDGASEIYNDNSTLTLANSLVQGGCPAGSTCTSVISSNPILGPLQNNGGYTKTMALGVASPAIDKGKNATCATQDQRGVARPQGLACDLGAYEVKAARFVSQAANDGWVVESGPGSNEGGPFVDSISPNLLVGDFASNSRIRGFLSFYTAPLSDTATIVLAKLRVKQARFSGSPFTSEGSLSVDLARPCFGTTVGLVRSDWQARATVSPAGSFGSTQLANGAWYTAGLNATARSNINTLGTTQFRLRFTAENNNGVADYLSFYSSEYTTAADRPVLLVYYNP